jgi:putative PEP-CTERM system histidine kinase
MSNALILWSHALAALLFGVVALWTVRRGHIALPKWPLLAMLGASALWALAVAGLGGSDAATRAVDGVRTLALLGLMAALHRRRPGTTAIYAVLTVVAIVGVGLQIASGTVRSGVEALALAQPAMLFRMMVDVAALVLVHNLIVSGEGGDRRIVSGAIGVVWFADLNLTTAAFVTGMWLPSLVAARGFAVGAAAMLIALALHRGGRATLAVSRTVAYQSLSLAAAVGYLALLAAASSAIAAIGGEYARLLQAGFVVGLTAAVLTLASSGWLRAWIKVMAAKHLFRHRYDCRAEWLRFTGTLGVSADGAPLSQRVIKAVADLTDSPAGLLLVTEGEALGVGDGWNWPVDRLPRDGAGSGFAAHLLANERIVELDPLRRTHGDAEAELIPAWLLEQPEAWAVVPLIHGTTLAGAIVLARPPIDRALDWEDFDLLRVAGRQVASHLAEARARDALAEAERFEEFNRRFAFIVHDIKNLVSGLTLVARNAERHADNPAFRADMVATLQDSAAKLTTLLQRLSANPHASGDRLQPVPLRALAQRVAATRSATHPVEVIGDPDAIVAADPQRLETLLGHLLQNAIEASGAGAPIVIDVSGDRVAVVDRGCGMSPSFVRDELFRPFCSSKPGGFGIGAYEARQLAQGMGGRLEVESREGEGSRFTVILSPAARLDAAA